MVKWKLQLLDGFTEDSDITGTYSNDKIPDNALEDEVIPDDALEEEVISDDALEDEVWGLKDQDYLFAIS